MAIISAGPMKPLRRKITWVVGAWIILLPVTVVARMAIDSVGNGSTPTDQRVASCRFDDWFCAPIYDPAVKEIAIEEIHANGAATGAHFPMPVFAVIWLFGLVAVGAIWLITRYAGPKVNGWRKMTWILVGWTSLSAAVAVAAALGLLPAAGASLTKCPPYDLFCMPSDVGGTAMSAGAFGMLGLIGFVLLGLIWLVTWQRQLRCPTCGATVPEDHTACGHCGQKLVVADSLLTAATANGES